MKKLIFLMTTLLIGFVSLAQNVGIGTTTPQSTLDVKGNHRLGGLSNFITYDSASGRIEWTNSNLFLPVSQYLIKHSVSSEGLYYNNNSPVNGQLEYRNAVGEPVFYTNFINSNGYFKGNLGVGVINPGAKLHVRNGPSEYIGTYQMGAVIEGDWHTYLQFLTPDWSESGVFFGRASDGLNGGIVYNSFLHPNGLDFRTAGNLTRMVIDQDGNVSIGLGPNNLLAKLYVSDGNVLFSAPIFVEFPGDPPVSGQGGRAMWYADKYAFRAGYVFANRWNKDSIGRGSFASGFDSKASGETSAALGYQTIASGHYSTAIGYKANASGLYSTAMGFVTEARGEGATAIGLGTFAKASSSLSVGIYNDSTDSPNPTAMNPQDRIFQIGIGTSNSTRNNAITVLRNGNVGIGTTIPGFPLNFNSTNGDKISLWGTSSNHYGFGITSGILQIFAATSADDVAFGYGSSGSFTETMRIKGNGNVGIGTFFPSTKLCVNGSIAYTSYIGACSDIRYKKDFTPISSALQSILSLNGFYYYWKKDEFRELEFSDQKQIGFSAQEVEKFFPEIVMTDGNGYKSVDYGRITPVLVEAIKEQQQQINSQQKQIDELKKLVEKLLEKF